MRRIVISATLLLSCASALADESDPQLVHNGVYVEDGGANAAACTVHDTRMRLRLDLGLTDSFASGESPTGEVYRGTVWFDDGAGHQRQFDIDDGFAGHIGGGLVLVLSGSRYFEGGLDSTSRGNAHFQGSIKDDGNRLGLYAANWMDSGATFESYIVTVDAAEEERTREDGSPVGDFLYCPDAVD
jgi:hypothetical protein